MGRSAHTLRTTVPVPSNISHEKLLSVLHNHGIVIKVNDLISGYKELENDVQFAVKGFPPVNFFSDDAKYPIKPYEVTEKVVLIPFIGHWGMSEIRFPVLYQDTDDGVKSYAKAPSGVMGGAKWMIEKEGHASSAPSSKKPGPDGKPISNSFKDVRLLDIASELQLVEEVTVECASWLLPFVKSAMENAHKDAASKILEKAKQ